MRSARADGDRNAEGMSEEVEQHDAIGSGIGARHRMKKGERKDQGGAKRAQVGEQKRQLQAEDRQQRTKGVTSKNRGENGRRNGRDWMRAMARMSASEIGEQSGMRGSRGQEG